MNQLNDLPDGDLARLLANAGGDTPTLIATASRSGVAVRSEAETLAETMAGTWGWPLAADDASRTIRQARPSAAESAPPPPNVRHVGRPGEPGLDYELGELIGQGGGGRVFEARQVAAGRQVAIKMMLPHNAGIPAKRSRFLREALLAAEFDHPSLLAVHEVGVTREGQPFFAMPRVDGAAWSGTIGSRSLSANLAILAKVADGVAHLHARDMVHLDVKPANVMLGPHGEALLMDWGLAARLPVRGKGRGLPANAESGGTPAYMAPEMARNDRALIGLASDVFLLGAILHEILVKRPPHQDVHLARAICRAADPLRLPKSFPGGKAGKLARQAMAFDPYLRPTASEFAEACRNILRAGQRARRVAAAASLALAAAIATWWGVRTSAAGRPMAGGAAAHPAESDETAASQGAAASLMGDGGIGSAAISEPSASAADADATGSANAGVLEDQPPHSATAGMDGESRSVLTGVSREQIESLIGEP